MRHGAGIDPPNRFDKTQVVRDDEHLEWDTEYLATRDDRPIEYIADESKSLISENSSPDIPFRYSINPYRGCIHGCSYCYARPTHEYLGYSAGLDFETKIVVKHDARDLLRDFLARDSYVPEPIMFSGVTDCYQPAEREFQLTRQCLDLVAECHQPVNIITKNALIVRDVDILQQLAKERLIHVAISITTLDPKLARDMEPRTSIPAARLRAIERLSEAGIPVVVMVAPVIPGLNESEIPAILESASSAGAKGSSYVLLRLPLTVEPVFAEWLERTQPLKAERVLNSVRKTRDGKLNSSTWGERMSGSGETAGQIRTMFQLFSRKHGLDQKLPAHDCSLFEPPLPRSGQMRLF